MNFEAFFEEVRSKNVQLVFDNPFQGPTARLSNEALFHLPLLAITVLLLAKTKRKPRIDELGQLVGECFERTFVGFQGSSQHLGWSANLRVRTVRALTFLETAKLVAVDKSKGRIVATEAGKEVIAAALDSASDLAYTLRVIERSYRNVNVERQISLGFE
jgi:hypothetical protein